MRKDHIYSFYNNNIDHDDNKENERSSQLAEMINKQKTSKTRTRKLCRITFIFEILVLMVIPLPIYEKYIPSSYFDGHDTIEISTFMSDYILAFMFIRLFFVSRSLFNYSDHADVYFKKLCKEYGFSPNYRFTIKSNMTLNPERSILMLFFVTIYLASYLLRIFEIDLLVKKDIDNYDTSIK